MSKEYRDPTWLRKKYWEEGLDKRQIACLSHHDERTIRTWMKKFGIQSRTRSEMMTGNKNPAWKGGLKLSKGRPLIWIKDHPNADIKNYILESRLVAGKVLGRYLKETECVHHINLNPLDNRPKNLLICTRSYHGQLHCKIRKLGLTDYFSSLL